MAVRTLHLLRHAKSSWDDPGLHDHDRPLAPRGKKAARLMGTHLAERKIRVSLVLCSSAVRARQTLEVIGPALTGHPDAPVEIRIEDGLYHADAVDLLARLRRVDDDTRSVLVIGHNPALQQLAESLAGDGDRAARSVLDVNFPTGALATISTSSSWDRLGPGVGYLESLVVPRALRG
jgi:phosphohistidine phosphatase